MQNKYQNFSAMLDFARTRFHDCIQNRSMTENTKLANLENTFSRLVEITLSKQSNMLNNLQNSIHLAYTKRDNAERMTLERLAGSIQRNCTALMNREETWLTRQADALSNAASNTIKREQNTLDILENLIRARDPRELLKTGFVCLTTAAGQRITSITHTTPGDTIRASLSDGSLQLTVNQITERKHDNT